jgi:hypothetical protein
MALLNDIQNAGLGDKFTFFDVSKQRGRPVWVDRVPMLYHQGKAYADEDLFALFAPPAPDIHDPRVRLQQSSNGASTSHEGEIMELPAYNEVCVLGGLCNHEALGPLDQVSGALDMDAPVELMILEECEPMPSGKNS